MNQVTEHFKWEQKEDLMTHEAKLIRFDFTVSRYDYAGIKDRRFKTGYRVMPESGVNTVINHIIVEDNPRYKPGQLWQIGEPNTEKDLGVFAISALNFGERTLIPVSLSQNKDKAYFSIRSSLESLYWGSRFVGESS